MAYYTNFPTCEHKEKDITLATFKSEKLNPPLCYWDSIPQLSVNNNHKNYYYYYYENKHVAVKIAMACQQNTYVAVFPLSPHC